MLQVRDYRFQAMCRARAARHRALKAARASHRRRTLQETAAHARRASAIASSLPLPSPQPEVGGDGDSKPSAGHKTEKSLNYDAVQTTGKTEKSLAVQMAEKPVNYATKSDSTNAKEAARGADQEDQPSDEHGIVHDGGISGSSWPFGHLAMLCEEDETDVSLQCFIPSTMQLCDSKGCRDICASEYNMCTALNEFMDNLLNSDSQPPAAPKKGGSSTFLADRAAAMKAYGR